MSYGVRATNLGGCVSCLNNLSGWRGFRHWLGYARPMELVEGNRVSDRDSADASAGSGRSSLNNRWATYEAAERFARTLGLGSKADWVEWVRQDKFRRQSNAHTATIRRLRRDPQSKEESQEDILARAEAEDVLEGKISNDNFIVDDLLSSDADVDENCNTGAASLKTGDLLQQRPEDIPADPYCVYRGEFISRASP